MACAECLARGLLLRDLAGRIDRIVDGGSARRARDLLALDDRSLGAAVRLEPQPSPASELERRVDELREELAEFGAWAVCGHEPDWPAQLEVLGEAAPRALFGRGARAGLDPLGTGPDAAATIVGSRRAGTYGVSVASELAAELGAADLTVVSGLALGVDAAAHRGALAAEGFTVAVMGTGPERAYPASARRLYDEICERGLVLSELPPGVPTFRWMFPARNRVMAALAAVTIVVEAAQRSGSLITTEMAADCGRLVGAVPGPVNSWRSAGSNGLLADGAAVIRSGSDVLDLLLGPGARGRGRAGPRLDDVLATVLDAFEAGACTADGLVGVTGLQPQVVAGSLTRLELAGYLRVGPAGDLSRTTLAPGARSSPAAPRTMRP